MAKQNTDANIKATFLNV